MLEYIFFYALDFRTVMYNIMIHKIKFELDFCGCFFIEVYCGEL